MRKLKDIMPGIQNTSVKEEELSLHLPLGSEKQYADILDAVSATGASDVAIGLTSLEDVFLATAGEVDPTLGGEADDESASPAGLHHRIWLPLDDRKPSQPRSVLYLARMVALMDLRDVRTFVFNSLLPIVFIIVGFLLSYLIDPKGSLVSPPSLSLLPSTIINPSPAYVQGSAFNNSALGPPLQWTDDSLPSGGELLARYESNGTLQYDPKIVSSLPLAISAITNSTLYNLTSGSPAALSVSVTNSPLPYVKSYLVDVTQLLVPMLTMLGFVPFAYIVIPIVFWRADHITTQLKFMGMSTRLQYIALFLHRFLFGFLPSFAVLLIAAGAFGSDLLGDGGRWLAYILLVTTTFLALIPFAMVLAPLFKSGRQVADTFPLLWNCLSIIPYIIVWLMTGNSSESVRNAGDIIGDVMTVIPTLAYQRGTQRLLSLQFAVDRASRVENSPVEWSDTFNPANGVLTPLLVNLAVMSLTTALVWYQTRDKISHKMRKYSNSISSGKADELPEGEDLLAEAVRADTILEGIAVRNLTKFYPQQKKAAVQSLNLAVAPSEIVVLLGPNGAGKTTAMKMLSGEEIPTAGLMKLGRPEDFDLAQRGELEFTSLYRRQVCGYCPQTDALFPDLTVKEHLNLASALKGLRIRSASSPHRDHVDAIIAALGVGEHLNSRSSRLSGGNRRKLSLALAMMGHPRVLFLDEVTTGMDPAARRSVWTTLRGGEDTSPPAMLMSTHYMDEATALSTRIGIIINGEMRAIGSVSELANRFSRAIAIEASLSKGFCASTLAEELGRALGIADLAVIEDFNSLATLRVPLWNDALTPMQQVAELFRFMEGGLKASCGVVYYNLSLMSLEQIFIDLVREQRA
ncbi:hypothetical protein FOZ62_022950 [Perkinsus olseni]|uniref:ABC transporter domain-containing protein n=1 Tax=Perkinsus olseni TaxID=32597 RepID=A0A7J6Q195_PEROL|nr:hypothetical protein FOZ62_022950 [Perkinsus olseni]